MNDDKLESRDDSMSNKLASLEATLLRKSDQPTNRMTDRIGSRATIVPKKKFIGSILGPSLPCLFVAMRPDSG